MFYSVTILIGITPEIINLTVGIEYAGTYEGPGLVTFIAVAIYEYHIYWFNK